jgi:Mce-associated membrane protein
VLLALLVLLLVAASVLTVLLVGRLSDRRALERARDDAVAAGRQAIVNLDSISAATVERDMDRVLAGATGTFKDQFERSRADLAKLVVANKTVSTGTVISAGVVSADTASATLLVAADRVVKDATTPQGATVHDRWRVYLEKRGGRWLVAKLEPVG